MSKFSILTGIVFLLFTCKAGAQNHQTVANNSSTAPINFPGTGCTYTWVNNNPLIGLKSNGTGDIPSFTAINNGTTPVTATITVTPVSTAFAYVPSFQKNTVTVVNIATSQVIATLAVGSAPYGVAVTPDGSKAYIANEGDASVSVISTADNTVSSTIMVDPSPISICVSTDGSKAYVASESGSVSVISTATDQVLSVIPVAGPYGITISPDGGRLYVTNLGSGNGNSTVSVLDAVTGDLVTTIPVGTYPGGVAISPDGKTVYVVSIANIIDGSSIVSAINTVTNVVTGSISAGSGSVGVAVSADGKKIFVTNNGFDNKPGSVSVIDAATNKVIANTPVGWVSSGMSFSPDGTSVYVGNTQTNELWAINTTTYAVTAKIPVADDPNPFGSFITGGTGCSPVPVTYTITLNPSNYNPDVTIPNTFTPNGDGINDTWQIANLNGYANCTVNVFSRYGQMVYTSVGYQSPWNGQYKGSALPVGSYYYLIDLKNGSKVLSGDITIIR